MEIFMEEKFGPVEQYVPHRGAMLFLEQLVEAGAEHAVSLVRVPRDGMFNQAGGVPSWVAIEYMAQTIAAWAGALARSRGEAVKLGFLLGSRKFETFQPLLTPGDLLRVQVQCELMGANGLGMFDCTVWSDVTCVARAKISVFEPADGQAYLSALDNEKDKQQ